MSNVWISKARKTGLTHEFFEKGYITMGWPKLPNLVDVSTKIELTEVFDIFYPGEKKMQKAIHVGQIWTLVEETDDE